ncbi:MAG: hypothetical protein K6G72_08940 [Lachnospiraceae bacterium]|nr:hypothetical protein [Lachnospiraceae bacterium]
MELLKKACKWTITVGVNSGYDLDRQQVLKMEEVISRYKKVAEIVETSTGVYISAVINESRTIYKDEWGCPKGGEYTYTLSGCSNPFFSDEKEYKEALISLTKELRKEFGQTTVLLEVSSAEVYYDREGE